MKCQNKHCNHEATNTTGNKNYCYVHYLLERAKKDLEKKK